MNFGGANLHGTRLCGATGLSLQQLYKTDTRAMHADRMVRLARMRDLDECLTQTLTSSVLSKLDVRDRSQAVLKALKYRLLE